MLSSAVTPPSSRTQLLPPKSSMLHLKVIVKLKKLGLVVFQKKKRSRTHTNPCQIVLIEEDDRPYLKYTDVLKNRPGGINNYRGCRCQLASGISDTFLKFRNVRWFDSPTASTASLFFFFVMVPVHGGISDRRPLPVQGGGWPVSWGAIFTAAFRSM